MMKVARFSLTAVASVLMALQSLSCTSAGGAGSSSKARSDGARQELPPDVHALSGIDFALPGDDLAPLDAMIGDARLVGLGETAHRSGGILKAKNRVIRYLIEKHGFRVVGIETEFTDALQANAYVQTCSGDATDIVHRHIRNTWHDASTASLLKWLCEFNQQHPDDRVTLIGFNNLQPWHDVRALSAYAAEHMAADAARITTALLVSL